MAIHSSILAWKIPWTEEPERLQSMQSSRVGYDLVTQQQQKRQITSQPAHSLSLVYNYCPPSFLKALSSPPIYLHFPLVTLPKISRTKLEQHEEDFCRLPPPHPPILGCAHCYSTFFVSLLSNHLTLQNSRTQSLELATFILLVISCILFVFKTINTPIPRFTAPTGTSPQVSASATYKDKSTPKLNFWSYTKNCSPNVHR